MNEPARRPVGPAKRRYEPPRLVASGIFGAEAATGSCCRGAGCTSPMRNTQRSTIDRNKERASTAS